MDRKLYAEGSVFTLYVKEKNKILKIDKILRWLNLLLISTSITMLALCIFI